MRDGNSLKKLSKGVAVNRVVLKERSHRANRRGGEGEYVNENLFMFEVTNGTIHHSLE